MVCIWRCRPLHPDVLRRKKNDNAEKAGVKQI